jgi:hypothetical protein
VSFIIEAADVRDYAVILGGELALVQTATPTQEAARSNVIGGGHDRIEHGPGEAAHPARSTAERPLRVGNINLDANRAGAAVGDGDHWRVRRGQRELQSVLVRVRHGASCFMPCSLSYVFIRVKALVSAGFHSPCGPLH